MGEAQTKIKSFFSDFFQYLISVGSAAVIIYFVLKYSFGLPADVKSNNKKLSSIEDKVDTSLAMGNYLMDGVYTLEQKQEKLYQIVKSPDMKILGLFYWFFLNFYYIFSRFGNIVIFIWLHPHGWISPIKNSFKKIWQIEKSFLTLWNKWDESLTNPTNNLRKL